MSPLAIAGLAYVGTVLLAAPFVWGMCAAAARADRAIARQGGADERP